MKALLRLYSGSIKVLFRLIEFVQEVSACLTEVVLKKMDPLPKMALIRYSYTSTLTRLLLHPYYYTPTLTRLLLHAYSFTPTLSRLQEPHPPTDARGVSHSPHQGQKVVLLHAYCYTPTLTRLLLHAYSYTPTLTGVALATLCLML